MRLRSVNKDPAPSIARRWSTKRDGVRCRGRPFPPRPPILPVAQTRSCRPRRRAPPPSSPPSRRPRRNSRRGVALSALPDAGDARADVRDLAGLDLLLLAVEAREGRLLTELYGFACRLRRLLGRLRRRDGVHDSKIIVHPESIEDEAQSLDSLGCKRRHEIPRWRFTASSLEMLFINATGSRRRLFALALMSRPKPSLIGTKVATPLSKCDHKPS